MENNMAKVIHMHNTNPWDGGETNFTEGLT